MGRSLGPKGFEHDQFALCVRSSLALLLSAFDFLSPLPSSVAVPPILHKRSPPLASRASILSSGNVTYEQAWLPGDLVAVGGCEAQECAYPNIQGGWASFESCTGKVTNEEGCEVGCQDGFFIARGTTGPKTCTADPGSPTASFKVCGTAP